MIAYHDASMGLGALRNDDKMMYKNRRYRITHERQRALVEFDPSRSQRCLKKTAKFLFSHIGLVGLVVVYAVAGGFLFQLLERRQEKLLCQEAQGEQAARITQLKQTIVNYIVKNTTSLTVCCTNNKDNTTVALEKIGKMLYEYRQFVINATVKYRYYGTDCERTYQWTYANALLFAITIITTIGYGNITPTTWEGQLCSICYATIGIPIFLLCVANISGVLGEMFRFLYAKVLCAPCSFVKRRRILAHRAHFEEDNRIGTDPARTNDWSLNNDRKNIAVKRTSNLIPMDDELDDETKQGYQYVAVPLTVTMIIIAAYIWMGSALFHSFEDWTMMQSGYFCFITLATIGFGDFVPGQRKDDAHASAKLILGAIYVLFGMAILAMCFDLMQEEIVAKFRWIGSKVGIIENNHQIDDPPFDQNQNRTSIALSNNVPDVNMNKPSTIIENEQENEVITEFNPNTIRRMSPRNIAARVHPTGARESNEGTLHQRAITAKLN